MSYYAILLVGAALARWLIEKRIPEVFAFLDGSGACAASCSIRLRAAWSSRLRYLCGTIGLLTILVFYFLRTVVIPWTNAKQTAAYCLIGLIDLLWGYVVGEVAWKLWSVSSVIRGMSHQLKFRVLPSHMDGCGGLAEIGKLCVNISYLFLSVAGWLAEALRWTVHPKRNLGTGLQAVLSC
jgi:hypothetical protein